MTQDEGNRGHDFWGLPAALHAMQYPAAGSPECAMTTLETILGLYPLNHTPGVWAG